MNVLTKITVLSIVVASTLAVDKKSSNDNVGCCPSGWIVHTTQCFRFVREKLNYEEAESFCRREHPAATLVVVEDDDELHFLRAHAEWNAPSWIGLRGNEGKPQWTANNHGMNINEMPWLITNSPFGGTSVTNCAAYYNPSASVLRAYIHFYNCALPQYFVCKIQNSKSERKPTEKFSDATSKSSGTSFEDLARKILRMGTTVRVPTTNAGHNAADAISKSSGSSLEDLARKLLRIGTTVRPTTTTAGHNAASILQKIFGGIAGTDAFKQTR